MSDRFDTFRPPPPEPDPWQAVPPADPDEDEELGPRAAAALLEQTTRQAERRFELQPPWLILTAAVVVLVGYGLVWLSVRNQHPYVGPAGWALGALYGTLVVWALVNFVFLGRRLGGRSSRQRRIEGLTFASVWICVYVFQGALYHVSHSHAVAYGIYPAIAPLLVVGAAATGYEVARERWVPAGFAAAAVALGAFAAFAGPRAVWGVTGIGFCTLLLVAGAAKLWRRHASA